MKSITTSIFNVATQAGEVRQGSLLVAEPFLNESYFNHGVLTVIDYTPKTGAMGVVMNYRTGNMLSDVFEEVDPKHDAPVYCGGPMGQDRLFFIHTLGPDIIPGARQIADTLYVGGDFAAVVDYVNSGYPLDGAIRFFVGYSAWSPGQLESEIHEGTWAVSDAPSDAAQLLYSAGDRYWHRCLQRMGETYRAWQLIPRNIASN